MPFLQQVLKDNKLSDESQYNEGLLEALNFLTGLLSAMGLFVLACALRMVVKFQPIKHPVYCVMLQERENSISGG